MSTVPATPSAVPLRLLVPNATPGWTLRPSTRCSPMLPRQLLRKRRNLHSRPVTRLRLTGTALLSETALHSSRPRFRLLTTRRAWVNRLLLLGPSAALRRPNHLSRGPSLRPANSPWDNLVSRRLLVCVLPSEHRPSPCQRRISRRLCCLRTTSGTRAGHR